MSRNWLITGTSSGFGRIMTERLLERGDTVVATLRQPDRLHGLQSGYPGRLHLAALDVTDTQQVRQVVDRAFAQLGRIDVIISNAGYGLFGAVEEVSSAQIRQQLDTNVIGSIELVRAVLPHLRAQGGGRILQLSSMGGQVAFPGLSLYHASKWAIEGFFESLVQEVASFGIEATLIEPGAARTQFGRGSMVMATPLAAYQAVPFSARRAVLARDSYTPIGDPEKMVHEMIASVDVSPAPRRLALGSDAYRLMHAALAGRLAQLEAQKDIALSTDASP
ncbi:SDR family oxidoreductase [Komagataeibacter rhaeticus]|uniref:SDR family oxidoreductase n=1 Tax=Komagataeibacter rhaeticus TaxID=215221 RepID=UPI0039ED7D54